MALRWHRGFKRLVPAVDFEHLKDEEDPTTCTYPECKCLSAIEAEIARLEAEWELELERQVAIEDGIDID